MQLSNAVTPCVLLCLIAANAAAQPVDEVRLSLREASPASPSCTLDVVSSSTAGEAILSCARTSPASHLGAHRALTASEAARLYALSEQMEMRPQRPNAEPAALTNGRKGILVVVRGAESATVDVSQGPKRLSKRDQELWQLLLSIADELRGVKR